MRDISEAYYPDGESSDPSLGDPVRSGMMEAGGRACEGKQSMNGGYDSQE